MTKKQQYTIPDLRWKRFVVGIGEDGFVMYEAVTPAGKYKITTVLNELQWWLMGYHRTDPQPCKSLEDGKAKAQEHFEKLLEQVLEPTK